MAKLLIVIPAYNEEANIVSVVEDLIRHYPQYDYVVVNDGSRDHTAALCRQHDFHMIDLPVNLGLAGAFQTGLRYAAENGYDCALQFDADGYSLARGSFLYRLVPPEEGQAPVRMQFYDGQDYIVASDFDISQALHKEYAMSIYPGGETGSEVRAVVKVGEEEKTCSLGFAPGRLIIRQ